MTLPSPDTRLDVALVQVMVPIAAALGWPDPPARAQAVGDLFAPVIVSAVSMVRLLHEIGRPPTGIERAVPCASPALE